MMKKDQRGFSAVLGLFALALIAAIAAVGYVAFLNMQDPPYESRVSGPQQKEKAASVDEERKVMAQTYSLILPQGWAKTAQAPTSYVGQFANDDYYVDKQGNYFVVAVDPIGRGITVDALWELKASQEKYLIESKGPNCMGGPYCSAGDGEYRIALKDSASAQLNGHTYFFMAGNSQRESGVDTKVYENLIESFEAATAK